MIYDRRSNLEAEQKGKGTEDAPESLTIIPNSEVLETGTLTWEGPMCVCVCASTYSTFWAIQVFKDPSMAMKPLLTLLYLPLVNDYYQYISDYYYH